MKPFKPNWSFLCLSMAWFYCSNICLWNYKLLFGQTTMGRIHAFCRKTDYVANTRFLGLFLTQTFRILLRFFSDFTQISVKKIGGWELCSLGPHLTQNWVPILNKIEKNEKTGKEEKTEKKVEDVNKMEMEEEPTTSN